MAKIQIVRNVCQKRETLRVSLQALVVRTGDQTDVGRIVYNRICYRWPTPTFLDTVKNLIDTVISRCILEI